MHSYYGCNVPKILIVPLGAELPVGHIDFNRYPIIPAYFFLLLLFHTTPRSGRILRP